MKLFQILLLIIFFLPCGLGYAQGHMSGRNQSKLNYRDFMLPGSRVEIGFSLGAANAMTDIAASKPREQASMLDVYSRGLSPSLSLFGRYSFENVFALRGSLSALMIKGNDRWSPDIEIVNRGKSFTNNIFEASIVGEVYLPKNYSNPKLDFRLSWMDFFVFGGLAAFYHAPDLQGPIIDKYDETIITTDDIYNNLQVAIPLGVGMKYTIGNRWSAGLDFKFRYTFFDYLDGFRRPYSDRNDFYFTGNLNIGFVIDSSPRHSNRIISRHIFQPKNRRHTKALTL